ncbi:hypothetical protein LKL35_37125 [Streptomyces sp. ET3-23]|uniref:hypothetical protein n=1 Tax=Streptomyces sp. ET3-23 TaxID=2885643 RepID=UPI001D0F6893|nr:hypothetical protein [Streptomyces sp. ET3-23]MCC2280942.1 hypothetical protein [Streptomyces sp. ET3-23]
MVVIPECNATLLVLPGSTDKSSPPQTLLVDCGEPAGLSAAKREQRSTDVINLLFKHLPKVIPGQRTIDNIIVTEASKDACGFLGEVMGTYGFGHACYAGNLGDYTADRVGESTAQWFNLQQSINMQSFATSTYNLANPTTFLDRGSTKIYIVAANFGAGSRGSSSGTVVFVNHGSTQLMLLGQAGKDDLERIRKEYEKSVTSKEHVLLSGIATRVVIGQLPVRAKDNDSDPWPWSAKKTGGEPADWLITAPGYTPDSAASGRDLGAWSIRPMRRRDLSPQDDLVVFASPGDVQKGAP